MMPYWARISIGAVFGLVAAVCLWLFVGIAWLTAVAAALVAAVGFLGSYFVWSADRLPEYEQVLFDRPNTLVAAVLVVAFAGLGFGTGYLGDDAPPTPADRVHMLYNAYQNNADAFAKQELDAEALVATLDALRVESDRVALELEALPEGDERDALTAANDALALAMDAMKACAGGTSGECMNARLSAADAQAALERARGST